MKTTSFTDLRRNLSSTIDGVADDHEPVLITRNGGKPSAVLMSLEDFASYEETHYLLRSPANAERLQNTVRDLDQGQAKNGHCPSEADLPRTGLGRLSLLATARRHIPFWTASLDKFLMQIRRM